MPTVPIKVFTIGRKKNKYKFLYHFIAIARISFFPGCNAFKSTAYLEKYSLEEYNSLYKMYHTIIFK